MLIKKLVSIIYPRWFPLPLPTQSNNMKEETWNEIVGKKIKSCNWIWIIIQRELLAYWNDLFGNSNFTRVFNLICFNSMSEFLINWAEHLSSIWSRMKIHGGISITVMVSKICLFACLFLRKFFEKRKKSSISFRFRSLFIHVANKT